MVQTAGVHQFNRTRSVLIWPSSFGMRAYRIPEQTRRDQTRL